MLTDALHIIFVSFFLFEISNMYTGCLLLLDMIQIKVLLYYLSKNIYIIKYYNIYIIKCYKTSCISFQARKIFSVLRYHDFFRAIIKKKKKIEPAFS